MKRNHELDALQTEARVQRNNAKAQRRQQLQTARKQAGPKQQQRKPERWSASDEDVVTHERIMPRNERDRRRAIAQAVTRTTQRNAEDQATTSTGYDGLVIEVSTGMCRVAVGGDTMLCRIRHHLRDDNSPFTNVVAVGDRVALRPDGAGGGMVEAVAPRRTVLARPDVFYAHKRQLIVANADQLLIVASWREPAIWFALVDRYLVTAARSDLPAILCVNKVDLVEDYGTCAIALRPYQELGVELILTSAQEGIGIDTLRAVLHDRVSVLAGLSGVGKSSLLAAAQPGLYLRTADVSSRKHEGRHTTTQATLVPLRDGGAVVDTPGIRQWGLGDMLRHELAHYFPDIATVAPRCRFNDCAHLDDEDCAVRAAVEHGIIAASRYKSYRAIYETL